MKKINSILLISGLLFLSSFALGAETYFSCSTSKGELSLQSDNDQLVYEMKNASGNVFLFSSPSYSDFLYNHYSRFQTDYMNVVFTKNNFKYTIFSNYEDGDSTKGITVTNLKNNKEYTYKCKVDGVDKLSDLIGKIQCNKDSSLGCQ
ncbi:hypothetical protein [Shimwellia blattae]|uniref:Uncharacterized protein n=1 Tax=Shimwellia blattae (strain ATCC 29907 / DSM 4481 / JCM 1650 / NBRC 105725 / CDC 9005-74) TaxID=630626 RepID=I2B6W5_SHIBC|nr:hypothetical protein [Shimwellia blattae]AFJ46269.1 hypothetical protein EBL_c11650 [Shimwellia blattae DSM 4481 = NBRC 105725]GAB83220.1 hypothetical protein EB105725_54_00040 [Shimwellia blattae DSM 4481 = NBRC 105725]VDY63733.1 Uncharacterised protein [Shimwellia blattae]VEC21877.1 Uncharacterised protein [Shimwellia blattae]